MRLSTRVDNTPASSRADDFATLARDVQACRRCPRMEGRRRVLGPANGSLSARILFVAEAPGRLGAERTGVPLSCDRTGRTFNLLLDSAGITRSEVFVTNAVLCNPQDSAGRNDRPTMAELIRCGNHLVHLIGLLDPPWVVTLGAVALEAVGRIEPHHLTLRDHVGVPVRWRGRWLIPLYHPGPRALIHRSLATQAADYAGIANLLNEDEASPASESKALASGSAAESES